MKDPAVYLRHIRDAIARIEQYTAQGRKAFFEDPMVQDAVIRNLEVIGEAVRSLPPELKCRHPQIPWRSITATALSAHPDVEPAIHAVGDQVAWLRRMG